MLKKKSTIFALIGLLCFVAAMYFIYAETKSNYDVEGFDEDSDEPEPEDITEVPEDSETTVGNEDKPAE